MRPIRNLLIAMGIALMLVACGCNGLQLTRNGKSSYVIVIEPGADSILVYSASELAKYFKQVSGAEIEIKTTIPDHQHFVSISRDTLSAHGYISINAEKGNIHIKGGDERYPLFATYWFIEHYLGVRKYTKDCMVIPALKNICVPENLKYENKPQLTTRMAYFNEGISDRAFRDWHGMTNGMDKSEKNSWGMWVHTFRRLIPVEKFFKPHPEYFSEIKGKRVAYGQLCLSNPEVLKQVIDNLRVEMEKFPQCKYWSVSQNDTFNPCECEHCTQIAREYGGQSGLMIWFVNQVAKAFPDKIISTLAYQYTRNAPVNIKPEPNVNIMFCSIECNRSQPFTEDSRSAGFVKDMQDWSNLTNNIIVWDYVVQFRNYVCPFPNFRVLQPNLNFFLKNGATMIFEQGSGMSWSDFYEMKQYLLAKLMWEPGASADSIYRDFMHGYYGKAADPLMKYFNLIHDNLDKVNETQFLNIYGSAADAKDTYLKTDLMKQYVAWFDEAENAVKDDVTLIDRVRKQRQAIEYAILEISMMGTDDYYSYTDSLGNVKPEMMEKLDRFVDNCNKYGQVINEGGFKAEDFKKLVLISLHTGKDFQKIKNVKNLAREKPVAELIKANPKYSRGDVHLLVDGLYGGLNYFNQWIGYEGTDMEVVVDLEKTCKVHKVHGRFLQDANSWIFLPTRFEVSVSTDNKTFRLLKPIENEIEPKTIGSLAKVFTVDVDSEARYLKVKAISMKKCPGWHVGAGNNCWLFADEIIAE